MKFTAMVLAAAAAVAHASMPAPFPAPAPEVHPSPDRPIPAPEDDSGEHWFDTSSSTTETTTTASESHSAHTTTAGATKPPSGGDSAEAECEAAFDDHCGGLTGKPCNNCVMANAMSLNKAGCDTLTLIAKDCTARRGLVELTRLPAPYPAPAPHIPEPGPAPRAPPPTPEYQYYHIFSTEATAAQPGHPQTTTGEAVPVTTTTDGAKDQCLSVFNGLCGQTVGKSCSNCVFAHANDLGTAGCDVMNLVAKSCPQSLDK